VVTLYGQLAGPALGPGLGSATAAGSPTGTASVKTAAARHDAAREKDLEVDIV
jgi:hypothetical protein